MYSISVLSSGAMQKIILQINLFCINTLKTVRQKAEQCCKLQFSAQFFIGGGGERESQRRFCLTQMFEHLKIYKWKYNNNVDPNSLQQTQRDPGRFLSGETVIRRCGGFQARILALCDPMMTQGPLRISVERLSCLRLANPFQLLGGLRLKKFMSAGLLHSIRERRGRLFRTGLVRTVRQIPTLSLPLLPSFPFSGPVQ